jgi:hypothetical protein
MQAKEARRSARVATKFLVAIEGMDAELVPRTGDISATGVYFEAESSVGDVGTVHWLHLASTDRARTVHVMACIVRTISLADISGARTTGVAFEFMAESVDAITALREFVRYALTLGEGGTEPRVTARLDARATAESRPDAPAVVRQLSVRSMTLETSWAMTPGERVRMDIVAPGMTRRIRLDGLATRVVRGDDPRHPERYRIDVRVQEETRRPLRHISSLTFPAVRPGAPTSAPAAVPPAEPLDGLEEDDLSRTLDDLLSALILPPAADGEGTKREHLSGMLSRVRLSTLFSLFDMDRMSGELTVRRGGDVVVIYVRDGQLVDVSPVPSGSSPRARIARMLSWDEGTFEFSVQPVRVPDRIGMSTTALLLDLMREMDERQR